jgi:hypothetical protein
VTTAVQRVEKWYEQNLDRLSGNWPSIYITSFKAADPLRGKVTIELQSDFALGFITFWNKGDVTVLSLDLSSKEEFLIDDRRLLSSENIELLLHDYVRQLAVSQGSQFRPRRAPPKAI